MALTDKNIVITPNIGSSADPKIVFSGANASTGAQTITLNVYPTNNGTISFEGSSGQLFSIANSLTGTIYAVSDISGVPSLEVLDSGLIKLAQYSGSVVVGGSTTDGTAKLQVLGGPGRFGNVYVGYGTYKNSIRPVDDNNLNFDTPSGYAGSNTSLRAPIFYDSDNTSYYIDPAGTSLSASLKGPIVMASTSWTGEVPGKIQYHSDSWYLQYSSYFHFRRADGGNTFYGDNGGNTWSIGSSRAPIFYDSDNTGYYADLSSSSWGVYSAGGATFRNIQISSSTYTDTIQHVNSGGNLWLQYGHNGPVGLAYGGGNVSIGTIASPAAKLHIAQSTPTSIGGVPSGTTIISDSASNNYMLFRNTADNGTYSGIAFQDNNIGGYVVFGNAGGGGDQLYVAGYGGGQLQQGYSDSISPGARTTIASWNATGLQVNSGDMRAPIYYDSNDTSYYLDANSTSQLGAIRVARNWGSGFAGLPEALSIRGSYPSYTFRSSTSNSVWLKHMDGSGEIQYYHSGSGLDAQDWNVRHTMYRDGTFLSTSSLRAPVFYDSNDTGYYTDPASTSVINRLQANNKYHRFGSSDNWDGVGQAALTNVHFQGHDHFWIGAGNGRWFTGTANSGVPSGVGYEHDLLITTMYSTGDAYRGITFATENTGAANNGWRLGKWYSGTGSSNSRLIVDGQIFAKGNHSGEYDFYGNDYDSYRDNAGWVGDSGSGWNTPAFVASQAVQIQSGNGGTNSAKPQLQFHQYGYGGPVIEFDGPAQKFRFGDYSSAVRITHYDFYSNGGMGPIRLNHDQIWTPSGGNLHFQYSSAGNIDLNNGGGYTFSRTSLRAPIFYDWNDTGYYVDPNGGSRLAHIYAGNVASSNDGSWNARFNLVGSSHARLDVVSNSDGIITTMYSHTGQGVGKIGTYSNHPLTLMAQGGADGGYVYNGSLRSPIFYDSNDTTYYVNPNGASNLYNLTVGNWTTNQSYPGIIISGNTGYNYNYSNGSWSGSVTVGYLANCADQWEFAVHDSGERVVSPFIFVGGSGSNYITMGRDLGWGATYIQAASSFRAPVFYDSDNTAYFTDPASRSRLSSIDFGDSSYYIHAGDWGMRNSTPYGWIQFGPANSNHAHIYTDRSNFYFNAQLVVNGGSNINTGDIRANIFYDNQDTGYYVDPNSTSRLKGLVVGYAQGSSLIEMYDSDESSRYIHNNSSTIGFLNSSGSWRFRMADDGNLVMGTYQDWMSNQLRSSIFYDHNDTSYYLDPNGTSYQRSLFLGAHDSGTSEFRFGEDSSGWYGDRWYWDSSYTLYRYSRYAGTDSLIHYHDTRDASRITYGRNIVFDDYGKGIVGTYSSYRYQGVFSMGDSYKLPADGTTTGNLYGMAWSHPNAGGTAGNLNTHGLLILENGGFLAAVSGSIRSRDDMRSPIFYDSNDTGYYVDANSSSSLNGLYTNNHYIRPGYMLYSDHGSWTGEYNKIQWHASNLYLQNAGGGYLLILRRGDGGERFYCDYNGNVTASGNITAYSDARLKTNVATIQSARALRRKLRGVTFDWIETGEHSYGLIAQEVEAHIPELVLDVKESSTDPNSRTIKTVDYSKLVSVLIQDGNEQDDVIEALELRVAKLETLVERLLAK